MSASSVNLDLDLINFRDKIPWNCSNCTFLNGFKKRQCKICGTTKHKQIVLELYSQDLIKFKIDKDIAVQSNLINKYSGNLCDDIYYVHNFHKFLK